MARTKGALGKKTLAKRKNTAMHSEGIYLLKASGCGCQIRKWVVLGPCFCEHKNAMLLVKE